MSTKFKKPAWPSNWPSQEELIAGTKSLRPTLDPAEAALRESLGIAPQGTMALFGAAVDAAYAEANALDAARAAGVVNYISTRYTDSAVGDVPLDFALRGLLLGRWPLTGMPGYSGAKTPTGEWGGWKANHGEYDMDAAGWRASELAGLSTHLGPGGAPIPVPDAEAEEAEPEL